MPGLNPPGIGACTHPDGFCRGRDCPAGVDMQRPFCPVGLAAGCERGRQAAPLHRAGVVVSFALAGLADSGIGDLRSAPSNLTARIERRYNGRVAWTTGFVVRVSSVAITLLKVYGFPVSKAGLRRWPRENAGGSEKEIPARRYRRDADRNCGGPRYFPRDSSLLAMDRVARGCQPGRTHPGKTRRDVCATRVPHH